MNLPQNKAGIIWGLIVLLATGIFIWELMTPLGQVEWLFYVPVLLLTMWLPYRRTTYIAAGAFTILIIAGHFLSPPGGFPNLSVFNRSVGVCMVWMTAALVGVWKRTEEALQQKESTLRGFYDSASMMMGVSDVEDDDIRPVSVNAATARFLGTTPEAMHNRLASELGVPREYVLKWIQHYRECVRTGGPVRFEYLRETPNGPRWLSATVCHVGGRERGPSRFAYIVEDITERKRVEEALRDSLNQLHALSAHMQSVREEEQTRLAREVHDELGQSLTGLQLGLTWLGEKLDPHQRRLQEKVSALLAMVGSTIDSVRRISAVLRPVVLDDLGLIAAMEWQARTFESHAGIPCTVSSNIEKIDLDQMRAATLFRILQESLTNVARHAGATKVAVAFTQMDRLLMLMIQDDGKGIAENVISDHRSLGLIGMQERAHACGGSVTVFRSPGGGTVVTARIPLPRAEQV